MILCRGIRLDTSSAYQYGINMCFHFPSYFRQTIVFVFADNSDDEPSELDSEPHKMTQNNSKRFQCDLYSFLLFLYINVTLKTKIRC